MRYLLLISAVLLFIGAANLPIGYYSFLRIAITIASAIVMFNEYKGDINIWIILFGGILILFNPISPIYLHDKGTWMVLDIIAGLIFGIKAF